MVRTHCLSSCLWSEARVSAQRLGLGDPRFVRYLLSHKGCLLLAGVHQPFPLSRHTRRTGDTSGPLFCLHQIPLCLPVPPVCAAEDTLAEGRARPCAVSMQDLLHRCPPCVLRKILHNGGATGLAVGSPVSHQNYLYRIRNGGDMSISRISCNCSGLDSRVWLGEESQALGERIETVSHPGAE